MSGKKNIQELIVKNAAELTFLHRMKVRIRSGYVDLTVVETEESIISPLR